MLLDRGIRLHLYSRMVAAEVFCLYCQVHLITGTTELTQRKGGSRSSP